ncbi:MAG: hypothetical protein M1542_08550 [Thermotogae bacterium]|jgi:hypothetical protein|nr:hypothetical protein [Thermotogota bacterium]
MAERKYENVKGHWYVRKARTIKRKGPHGEIKVIHLKAKRIYVKPHKARKPRARRTSITVR